MAVESRPTNAEADTRLVYEVSLAVQAGNLQRAYELAGVALGGGVKHPTLFNARGLWLEQQGRFDDALIEYRRALALAPGESTIHNAIGLCLLQANRLAEAVAAFDAAIALFPNSAQTHYRRGWALGMLGDHDDAKRAHERAIALKPDFADSLASLASIAATDGYPAKTRDYAERALKADPQQATALIAMASADLLEKEYQSAETRLRKLLADAQISNNPRGTIVRARALGLLGDALDGQDKPAEAFTAYTSGNDVLRRMNEPRFAAQQRPVDAAKQLAAAFANTLPHIWQTQEPERQTKNGPKEHVFLLGFVRSGTTLLEQVLATSPDVVDMEERELLNEPAQQYLTSEAGLNALALLDGETLDRHRAHYWNGVREIVGDVEGKVFVDKLPFATIKLPLISKLFPRAKIIFAIRDPRDVVLSCFRRHFEINTTMFEFLALTDGARFYDAVMSLASLYEERLPLDLHKHRYEDMIEDFDGRVRAVCEFIGIEWTDAMRDFGQISRKTEIRSPSAPQVRRGLYGEGAYQWRRYANEIAPVLPILQPWVEKFGYPKD
ncbi:MAG TPA: sulfotransferase [Rhizomicrobium sp.]|jgi:tetratricopeptide (TPR) repeat protein|nr:sulfotransferase [Rhizomicrobium sp.]